MIRCCVLRSAEIQFVFTSWELFLWNCSWELFLWNIHNIDSCWGLEIKYCDDVSTEGIKHGDCVCLSRVFIPESKIMSFVF